MDLVEFLNARLAEDEADANEVHLPRTCGCVDRDGEFSPEPHWCGCGQPARVLREVEAKRKVLEWYADSLDASALFKEKLGTGTHMATAAESYLNVMRGIASAWSDHPDYRAEWHA